MLPDFETYLMRHGESWIQAILEQIERFEGIVAPLHASLEERWHALQNASSEQGTAA